MYKAIYTRSHKLTSGMPLQHDVMRNEIAGFHASLIGGL